MPVYCAQTLAGCAGVAQGCEADVKAEQRRDTPETGRAYQSELLSRSCDSVIEAEVLPQILLEQV